MDSDIEFKRVQVSKVWRTRKAYLCLCQRGLRCHKMASFPRICHCLVNNICFILRLRKQIGYTINFYDFLYQFHQKTRAIITIIMKFFCLFQLLFSTHWAPIRELQSRTKFLRYNEIFCNFLLYVDPVNSNPSFSPRINFGLLVLSFVLQKHSFKIVSGKMRSYF